MAFQINRVRRREARFVENAGNNATPQVSAFMIKRRLDDLQRRIESETDEARREHLFARFTNLAAGSPQYAFDPSEISRVERHGSLANPELLEGLREDRYLGSRPDFLPLHYLARLLGDGAGQNGNRLVYILDGSSQKYPEDKEARNLRALEEFMLAFAQRIPEGQCFEVHVHGKRLHVYNSEPFLINRTNAVSVLGQRMHLKEIPASSQYALRNIRSGNVKVSTTLYVATEQRSYIAEGVENEILVSYLTSRKR